jgi:tetratricopeptide (TPR) repeat protein
MIKQTQRTRWILAAVVAAMPVAALSPKAMAQSQQSTTGHALDANNRIGSGGTNTYRPLPSAGVTGNNIVTGVVGNGKQFHGSITYTDPTSFRGFAPGQGTDAFVRDSAGVGVANTPPPIPGATTEYYGPSKFAPPPQPGFVANTIGGGYVPAQPIVVQPNDARLGAHLDATPTGQIPKPGELLLPGPLDPTSNLPTVLSASPLTGIRQLNASDANDASFLRRYTGARQDNVLDRLQMNSNELQRMRQELLTAPTMQGTGTDIGTGGQGPNLSKPLGQPMEAPADAAIRNTPISGAVPSSAMGASIVTDQGSYSRVAGTPSQQSAQYDELKKRLERYQSDRKTTAEKGADQFNLAMRLKKEAEAKAVAGKKPEEVATVPTDTKPKPDTKPAPLTVKSMTSGVSGKGLKDMLATAESLMKDGKFTSAIDQYAAAEQVAPNQPLVWIGRANAELGASYYNRAENHLKEAFKSDQALLMAQYDLRSFLGEDRLQSVIKDLKEIASTDQKSPTPVFLLAYIHYNTGSERRAAGYLDLAEKRSEGKDPIYKLLREHWSLPVDSSSTPPADSKSPELNK